ncbi:MAG: LysM peptidoglycan-binding domain-containing protein [Chloroflexi bacterium]|nr:LysM peptidoglycan-binding domain-containing protein [Chloroflexota bacterium]
MKPRTHLYLLVCALLLAGCYRQTEESFQQVDSAEVIVAATAAEVLAEGEVSAVRPADEGGALVVDGSTPTEAGVRYITPESVPGQIEQPTLELPTGEPAESGAPARISTPFVIPSPTLSFEEQLDPNDECVYTVRAGNVLFRLALAWGTTYQTIMQVNQMDSEDLSIGQLLLIPDCESSEPTESPPAESALEVAVTAGPVISDGDAENEPTATPTPEPTETPLPTATPRPPVHVVSAGETIESISLRYRVDVRELITLNQLTNPNRLGVGQELKLPE